MGSVQRAQVASGGLMVASVTFATEKMAPRFGDLFHHMNFDQRICCNAGKEFFEKFLGFL